MAHRSHPFRAFSTLGQLETEIDFLADFFLQDIGGFVGRAVVFDQAFANLVWTRANQLDLALEKKAQTIDRIDVERIANGDDQSRFAKADWNNSEPAGVLGPNLFDDLRRNNHRREVDPIHVGLGGEGARHVRLRNDAVLDENIDDVVCAIKPGASAIDLRARHQSNVLHDAEDVIFVVLHL